MNDYPIVAGSALFTLVDPSKGHEVAYNRWYERDHFYAGCMIGPWLFAGKRWVATRAMKDLRFPEGDTPVASPHDKGSYLATYWVLEDKHKEHFDWAGHQVVDDPAVGVQQQRILLLARLQDFIVAGHEPLELGGGVGAGDLALAHVRHVEQAGVFAGPTVLGQDALILDRHVIAAEAHHPGPQGAVRGVQGRGLQGLIGHGSGFHGRVLWRSSAVLAPPLS